MQYEQKIIIKSPCISVIMLTYNREKLIGQAIESIMMQDFKDFELIIIDNASTDKSGIIAEQYAKQDERMQVIHRQDNNIGAGRNAGIEAARGEFITFVDDDDFVEKDYLTFLYSLITTYHADVAICGRDKIENGQTHPINTSDDILTFNSEQAILQLLQRQLYNSGFPAKLFHKILFDKWRFNERDKYEDVDLMYKILADAQQIVFGGQVKYHVYRHDGNNSIATEKDEKITSEYLTYYRRIYHERTLWLNQRFPHLQEAFWYFEWSFQISMVNKIISCQLVQCQKHLDEMREELRKHDKQFLESPWLKDFEREWFFLYI